MRHVKLGRLQVDTDHDSISLNISEKIKRYIMDDMASNYSEWMREAGREFLDILETFVIPNLSKELTGHRIMSISKPTIDELEKIYVLIRDDRIFLSRSEYYRFAAIFKIITDNQKKPLKHYKSYEKYIKEMEKEIEKEEQERNRDDLVRIPMGNDENGEPITKTYKVLRSLI